MIMVIYRGGGGGCGGGGAGKVSGDEVVSVSVEVVLQ